MVEIVAVYIMGSLKKASSAKFYAPSNGDPEAAKEIFFKVARVREDRPHGYAEALSARLDQLGFGVALSDAMQLVQSEQHTKKEENISNSRGGSSTARSVCTVRYVLHEVGLGPDPHAVRFVGEQREAMQKMIPGSRTALYEKAVAPFGSSRAGTAKKLAEEPENVMSDPALFLNMRTLFHDDAATFFMQRHPACNLVILGAGFDARFHRLRIPAEARLYEVDAPGTQEVKLAELGDLADNTRIVYVSCDFQRESWVEALRLAGLDTSLPSCFLWEGVTMYLHEQVVRSTLASVASEFSGAVGIAFDYFSPFLIKQHAERLKSIGEPWLFGADSQEMEAMVRSSGLEVLDNASSSELAPLYGPLDSRGLPVALVSSLPVFMFAGRL